MHVMSPSLSAGAEFAKVPPDLSLLGQVASRPSTDTVNDAIAIRAKSEEREKNMIYEDESEATERRRGIQSWPVAILIVLRARDH